MRIQTSYRPSRRGFALGLLVFVWLGCESPQTPGESPERGGSSIDDVPSTATRVSADTVLQTQQSGISERERVLLADDSSFAAWWSRATGNVAPDPDAPEIDFGQRMVAAAAMGRRSTGGHVIEIVDGRREGEDLWVVVRETTPGDGCVATQALSSPAVAVTLPRVGGEVRFVEEEATHSC